MLKLTIFQNIVLALLSVTITGFKTDFNDFDKMLRMKREVMSESETTTQHSDTEPIPSDVHTNYQETPTDINLHDQGYVDHSHGDMGQASANEGQGSSDVGSHLDPHSEAVHQSDYQSSDPSANPEHFPNTESHGGAGYLDTADVTGSYHNPLHMTRPGEAPPRFMRFGNAQPAHQESLPRALPFTQDPAHSETGSDGVPTDQGHLDSTGEPGVDTYHTDSGQDMPMALPQTQDYVPETGGDPVALPQKQGVTKTRLSPSPTVDKPPQRQRTRSRPRPLPREPPKQGVQDSSRDLLATAAMLNPDVQDTVSDSMDMIAKQQAMDQLDRQLSGATRDRQGRGRVDTRGRAGPSWGKTEQSSAPRRSSGRSGSHSDPLDTIARVHTMKAKADLIQDHVDTAHDIHQDRTDYMYGRQDYDPYYDTRYGRNYDRRYDSSYDRHSSYDRQYPRSQTGGGKFPTNQNFDSRGRQYDRYPPHPPYYHQGGGDRQDGHYHNEDGYYNRYEGYQQPGFKLDINTGLPCNNMSDPRCQARGYGEIQIETPHGEMDMEPGELDLEGAAAADLLRMLGFARSPGLPPGHQEININHNVLAALQSRFGVNNTADVRRMSSNREFQTFMYQVLTHSGEIAPGEYNANLTKTEVDRLLTNLDGSRSRLRTSNLDHASINITPPKGGANTTDQSEAVLTIDGGSSQTNTNLGLPMLAGLGNIPGFASPLVQNGGEGQAGEAAQPGSVAALVQTVLGGGAPMGEEAGGGEAGEGMAEGQGTNGTQQHVGGEAGEGQEGAHKTNGTLTSEASKASEGKENVHNPTQHTSNITNTVPIESHHNHNVVTEISGVEAINNTSLVPNTNQKPTVSRHQMIQNTSKETDIQGKDGNPKLSKDTMAKSKDNTTGVNSNGNRPGSAVNEAGGLAGTGIATGAGAGAGIAAGTGTAAGAGSGAGAGTGTAAGAGAGTAGPGPGAGNSATGNGAAQAGNADPAGVQSNSQPIGLSEAGIDPGAHGTEPKNQIPTEAIERGYKASTAFAIASATLIALAIIIGPILCLLCKMREKAEERKRKEKAMKNRDVSDNNIWDAMMLHEFGPEAPNFVANEAEAAANYYKTDYNKSQKQYYDIGEIEPLKTGHLP